VGSEPSGDLVRYDGLPGTQDWASFFNHRCEQALARLIDDHTELFFDAMEIFGAKPLPENAPETARTADFAHVVHPLPLVPILICYWKPDGEFDSNLTVHFDRNATSHVSPRSLYMLVQGIVVMLTRVARSHGDFPV